MSDRDEPLEVEELSTDRPLNLPTSFRFFPCAIRCFSELVHAAARWRAKARSASSTSDLRGKLIGVFTQRDATVEEPQQDDLYRVGTASHIHKMFKLPDGSLG
jgi:ATP-dependent Lon protease